ncbi:MAG TPA: AraC family transcriptional regulator [Candidatus Gemmiger stercoravium]|uniref:AraC family transcriptional regulator n=1 Tax=uncultured Subdoligranulum sp. TaxID=512298 RepID=UPI001F97A62F|nr:AraC family transcriptional regulator [uncultured Subdoligranulum sp.]HJC54519.1 AraC family transcriptional regulator [Candidatus Gemmiger stercoravium]
MPCSDRPPFACRYETDAVPLQIHEPVGHFEYTVLLVLAGGADAAITHRTYRLRRGSLLFIGRLESHAIRIQTTPYERYVARLSLDMLLKSVPDTPLLSIFIRRPEDFRHLIQLDEPELERILPVFSRLAQESPGQAPFALSRCSSLLNLFLIELYRMAPQAFPSWSNCTTQTAVVAAQQYMTRNFRRPLTLEEVAEHAFVSRHTLSLAFRQNVGMTYKDYLILLRITEAKRLLVTTDAPVSKIGELVGYSNVNNFIKIFRERMHTTPLQYRLARGRPE